MELTPLDIRNQTFHKKNFGGIDPDEVKAFLETAATAFEQMSRNRTDLTERLKIAEERVNYYRQIEKTIQDAVVTMQKTVDEVKANAEKEAELMRALEARDEVDHCQGLANTEALDGYMLYGIYVVI